MRTNIEIDDEVLAELMKELGIRTKREAVDFALRDTLRARRQLKALEAMRGSGWHGDEEEVRRNRYTVVA